MPTDSPVVRLLLHQMSGGCGVGVSDARAADKNYSVFVVEDEIVIADACVVASTASLK